MNSVIRKISGVVQRYSIRYSFGLIPKYKPQPIKHQYIKLPERPKMDPNDPTETYDIAKLPNTFNAARTNFKYMHSLGSQYVSVAKDGKVYHLFDASRMPFGKMCQRIAQLVSGRHKPIYKSNSAGIGDKCIVINAENMFFTGKKIFQKNLTYHTGYVGHLRRIQYKKLIKEKPEQLISYGIWKCLPKNKLRMQHLEYLDIFRTREHTYTHILPQIMPRKQHFVYNGSIYEDLKNTDGTIVYSANEISKEKAQKEFGLKVDLDQLDTNDEIFTPFSQRDYDVKSIESPGLKQAMMNAYKRKLRRYRRYYAEEPKVRSKAYNPGKTYVVTSPKQLRELGLQNREPLDDDPEIEDEIVK